MENRKQIEEYPIITINYPNIIISGSSISEDPSDFWHPQIKEFLKKELGKIQKSPFREEILSAHLHPLVLDDRLPVIMEKMKQILGSN